MPNYTIDQLTSTMMNTKNIRNITIAANVDAGKCFCKGSKIQLFNGRIVPVETLKINDSVIGLDGKSKKILEIHEGKGMLYEIKQENGNNYIVNEKHILVLKLTNYEGIFWVASRKYYMVRYIKNLRIISKCFQSIVSGLLTQEEKQNLYIKAKEFLDEKRKEKDTIKGMILLK